MSKTFCLIIAIGVLVAACSARPLPSSLSVWTPKSSERGISYWMEAPRPEIEEQVSTFGTNPDAPYVDAYAMYALAVRLLETEDPKDRDRAVELLKAAATAPTRVYRYGAQANFYGPHRTRQGLPEAQYALWELWREEKPVIAEIMLEKSAELYEPAEITLKRLPFEEKPQR